jgi:exosortase/archaeosortase family protein
MDGETTIMLDRFNLDVGVPCSGLKLFVAVTAFTVLFIYLGLMIRWDMFREKLGLPPADQVTPETPSVFGRPGFGKAFASTFWPVGVLLALILPLCLFINSLRIVLIGLVGNQFGNEAGHKFHDYSGYITLVVCFYLLFLVAKGLKWKV